MNTRQIIIPTILVMGMMLLTIGLASATTNIQGQVFWSDGSACSSFDTTGVPEITTPDSTPPETYNATGSIPPIILFSGNWYVLTLDEAAGDIAVGDLITYDYSCSGETNTTASFTCSATGGIITFNITLDALATPADLIVDSITANCGGYLFGNQSNEICAKIKNNGSTAAPASHAKFDLSGGYSATVSVSALNPGENETVCIIDPTIRAKDDSVTITVTADCNDEVTEGTAGEANNVSNQIETVYYNGYKGKTYAPLGSPGPNMTTWKTYDLNGSLVYSAGDSSYQGCSAAYGGDPDWTDYDVTWGAGDLDVPGTVEEARLYVMYTWAKNGVVDITGDGMTQPYISMEFNGNPATLDAHYWDEKGWGTSYPYGMLVYNVTGDFDKSGNTANLTNSFPGGNNVSMRGMELVVIYEDNAEPRRQIFVNEEFDQLYGGSGKCTTPDEATAWAPITGPVIDMSKVATARLITFAPGADPTEGELIFNGEVWADEWNDNGDHQIGVSDRDVTDYLNETDNLVGFQSSADYMEASNAFLVVEMLDGVNVEIDCDTICSDPSCRTTVDITLNSITNYGSGTIDLYFDETVVEVDSIGMGDSDSVTPNRIGAGHWAISASNSNGVSGSVVFATVTFKPTGLPSECTDLKLTVEKLYDRNFNALPAITTNCSICIYESDAPFVTNPAASPAVILNSNGRARVPGTDTTRLNVTVTDDTWVDTVTVNLAPILLGSGNDTMSMFLIDGTNKAGIWSNVTNADRDPGVNLTHCLAVNATDHHDNSNIGQCIDLTVLRRGDVHRDNKVDIADYNVIAMYTVGLKPLPDEFVAGTVPADSWNGVDMADALYIAMYTVVPGYPAP